MANKKISELPLITALSGSGVGGSVIPVVVGGTTNQISAENFSRFMNAYAAQTGSANTFTANQTINANLSVTGTTAIGGNTTIGGTLVVAGRLTAEEFHTEITTASVIYSSGSTKFGDSSDDTHQFTGSIQIGGETLGNAGLNAFSGSFSAQIARVQQATASLQTFTASQDNRNFTLSQVTASFAGEIGGLEAYSASLKAAAIVSSSTQIQNYDVFALNSVLYIATGSMKGEIAGIEAYTASLKGQSIVSSSTQIQNYDLFALNSVMYIATGSIKGEIAGIESYTASLKSAAIVSSSTQIQNYDVFALNSNLYTSTGSIKGEIAGIESYTASLKTAAIVSSSTQVQNYDLFALNSNLYIATGSLIAITNGLMAFTAALDNTYATDAQLYQLYQATRSLELHSGSMVGVTNDLMQYTASLKMAAIVSSSTQVQNYDLFALNSNLYNSTGSIKGEIAGIESYTASLKNAISVSGTNVQIIGDLNVNKLNVQYISSSILVTSGSNIFGDQSTDKHEFTGSVAVSGKLYVNDSATNFLIEGNGFSQTYLTANGAMVLNPGFGGVEMVGSYRTFKATDITADGFVSGEIRATNDVISGSVQLPEIAGLEAYTASLKGQTIVSSSQQIKDYIDFVNNSVTSSMYVYSSSFAAKIWTPSGTANQVLYQSAGGASSNTTTDANFTWNSGTSTLSATNIQVPYNGKFQSSLDPTNNISMHDGSFGIMAFRNGGTDRITLYRTTDTIKLSGSLVLDSNNPSAKHEITGSLNVSGSSHTIQNGYVILQQVSASLNFVDDAAAAAGGVPLGGLYRSGNFIVIRIV